MKFIKFQNNILNVNRFNQFLFLNTKIFCATEKTEPFVLEFSTPGLAQRAFEKIAEFLSASGCSAISGPPVTAYRFSSDLLDLDRIE